MNQQDSAFKMISAIALDLGTTSVKTGLLNQGGALGHIAAKSAPKITVTGGCYESDALAYATTAEQVLDECVTQADDCKMLGLCSQRSSFLIWERSTGKPVTPLISWQDNRGAPSCAALRAHENSIREITGLPLTPYYFAPKLRVMLLENTEWLARLEAGELLAGTLDTFLIWRWSGGKHFMTDASMAARTLLMDIRSQQWSPPLCELFGIPINILPEIKPSVGLNLKLDNGLILQASIGDQSAAFVASISEGCAEALVNLGTGCFVVRYLPTSVRPDPSTTLRTKGLAEGLGYTVVRQAHHERFNEKSEIAPKGYLRTLVYQDNALHTHLAIEGTLNSIAAALAPYPANECLVEDLFSGDIFCLAEPSGLGAPYFRNDFGIHFSQPVEHLAQRQIAALLLEAVIFRVARILEDFHHASAIERVYLSGGLSGLACLQQGIARCVPFDVYLLSQTEASLQGAALLAAEKDSAFRRKSEKISAAGGNHAPPEKYLRWKKWLDALLMQYQRKT
jgi:glycerol kinase